LPRALVCAIAVFWVSAPHAVVADDVTPVSLPSATIKIVGSSGPAVEVKASPQETSAAASIGYVVKRGDTLSGIASRFGISLSSLLRANGIRNADKVRIGQRLVVPSTGGPAPKPNPVPAPSAPASGKSILVSISKQRMFTYEGGQLVNTYLVSTGERGRPTAIGNWRVQTKMPEAFASTWQLRMPWWMGIYNAGPLENGIHALPINKYGQTMWAGLLGKVPASYGCVVLSTTDAAALYKWAPMGTPVIVRY
jgi:LysM repeat protein